jgi:hypothetical protein
MDAIETQCEQKYSLRRPGNSYTAWTTCEPKETEQIFRRLIEPYLGEKGSLRLFEHYVPTSVKCDGETVTSVNLRSLKTDEELAVKARLTIDATDWGDVVQLAGAGYMCGPDLRSRFSEASAPFDESQLVRGEMNPLTYCLLLREADEPTVIPEPPHYDERRYYATTVLTRSEFDRVGWLPGALKPFGVPWRDTAMTGGPYSGPLSVYHYRRLVDRRHDNLAPGTEAIVLAWTVQDYPLYDFPEHVSQALEAVRPGASQRNIVEMSRFERQIVFEDAKQHSLGALRHLQTTVYDKQAAREVTFRGLRLADDFGTPDHAPPKPYIREGLRIDALYVLREQDVRDLDDDLAWARHMVPDSVFGFQFNLDFHPTRRLFQTEDRASPWTTIHTATRNWNTFTDRAGFPLRSLIPVNRDGLLVTGKNLGMTSIVSSALRLHGHGMLTGQASATIAAQCLSEKKQPRDAACELAFVRQVQLALVSPPAGKDKQPPGVLLWPYHDVSPEAPHFAAVNHLALRSIMPGEPGVIEFFADDPLTRRQLARALARALLVAGRFSGYDYAVRGEEPAFADVPASDKDYPAIESLVRWKIIEGGGSFEPEHAVSNNLVAALFKRLGWQILADDSTRPRQVRRGEFAMLLWNVVAAQPEVTYPAASGGLIRRGQFDTDGDGLLDQDDALPRDRDNDSIPDLLDPDSDDNGVWDLAEK